MLWFAAVLTGCSENHHDATGAHEAVWDQVVPLVRVLALPEQFHGRTILVSGYLHLEFEGNCLYLDKNSFESGLSKNSIWVNYSSNVAHVIHDHNDKYVSLHGTFTTHPGGHGGHMGLACGEILITNATAVSETGSRKSE